MKRLIAKRAVLYGARMYQPGDPLPAGDVKMVDTWLRAGSAAWAGDTQEAAAEMEAARHSKVNDMAAEAIRDMGVTIENDAGEFVGASSMEDQIRALFGNKSLQNNSDDGVLALDTVKLVDGHLDPEQLATMKKADLVDLADKLGVDISAAKNNAERAALIAAVTVQAPADEDGGAR